MTVWCMCDIKEWCTPCSRRRINNFANFLNLINTISVRRVFVCVWKASNWFRKLDFVSIPHQICAIKQQKHTLITYDWAFEVRHGGECLEHPPLSLQLTWEFQRNTWDIFKGKRLIYCFVVFSAAGIKDVFFV